MLRIKQATLEGAIEFNMNTQVLTQMYYAMEFPIMLTWTYSLKACTCVV